MLHEQLLFLCRRIRELAMILLPLLLLAGCKLDFPEQW